MAQSKLIWDESKSDALNFLALKPKIIDRAVLKGRSFALDEFGMAYDIMSAAEFLIFAGHAAMIRPPAGPAHGVGAALTNWKKADDMENLQKVGRNELRAELEELFPDRLLAPMRVNRSLRTITSQHIMVTIQARLGTLSRQDLDYLMAQVKTPCPAHIAPDAFLANWQASLSDLAEAGQPLAQLMATDALQKCFGPEYVECWRAFVRQYPLVADRTVERLCQAIITFARDDLPLLNTHVLIGANKVVALQEELKGLKENLQAMEAQQQLHHQAFAATAANSRKRGRVGSDKVTTKQPSIALSARPFCWSHGPRGHPGNECTSQLPGHKPDATWAQQKGSKWKEIFERRGWPTA